MPKNRAERTREMYYVSENGNYCVSEMEAPEVRCKAKGKWRFVLAAGALTCALAFNGSVASASEPEEGTLDYYREIASEMDTVQVLDAQDLTDEMLENRADKGTIYIEAVYGICVDDEGNGEILNAEYPDYNYIYYGDIEGIQKGDVVLSYLIYAPDTNYTDDVIERFDYIIDGEEK